MLTEHEKRWVICLWELDWTFAEIAHNIVRKRCARTILELTEEVGDVCKSEKRCRETKN